MWGFAIFCEYPGCRVFEPVEEDGSVPRDWFLVEQGVLDMNRETSESVGTYCGWEHLLGALHNLAPVVDAKLDIRSPGYRRGRPIEDVPLPAPAEEVGHA